MARAMSVCSRPGCFELVPRSGKCAPCKAKANKSRAHITRQRGHDTKAWARTRTAYIREHPYCEDTSHADVAELLRPLAKQVDHVDGLGPNGPRGHDWANLEALCVSCHSRRTGRDFGFGADRSQ